MAFNENISYPPRSGSGHEIYIFPSVTVPPTNSDDMDNQEGAEPSIVTPGAANVSDVELGVVGSIIEATALSNDYFPLKVKVTNSTFRSVARDANPRNLSSNERSKLRGASRRFYNFNMQQLGLNSRPRFVLVKPDTPDDYYEGINPAMRRFPGTGIYLPNLNEVEQDPYTGHELPVSLLTRPRGAAAVVHDAINDRLIILTLQLKDTSSYNEVYIHALSYKQGLEDYVWGPSSVQADAKSFFTDLGASDLMFNGGRYSAPSLFQYNTARVLSDQSITDYTPFLVTGVELNGAVYAIVAEPEELQAPTSSVHIGSGSLFVTVFSEGDDIWDRFKPIGDRLKVSPTRGTKILSIDSASTRNRAVIAMGVKQNLETTAESYEIMYGASGDMFNWGDEPEQAEEDSTTLDPDFKSLATPHFVFPGKEDGNIDDQGILRGTIFSVPSDPDVPLSNPNYIWFASGNKIYETIDGCSCWTLMTELPDDESVVTFLSGSKEPTSDGNYILYAITSKGILFKYYSPDNDGAYAWYAISAANLIEVDSMGIENYFRPDPADENLTIKPTQAIWNETIGIVGMAWKTDLIGWLIGRDSNALYRTEDGGLTWVNIMEGDVDFHVGTTFNRIEYLGSNGADDAILLGGSIKQGVGSVSYTSYAIAHMFKAQHNGKGSSKHITTFISSGQWSNNFSVFDMSTVYFVGATLSGLPIARRISFSNPITQFPGATVSIVATSNIATRGSNFTSIIRSTSTSDEPGGNDLIISSEDTVWKAVDGAIETIPHWAKWKFYTSSGIRNERIISIIKLDSINFFAVFTSNRIATGRLDLQNRRLPSVAGIQETGEFVLACLNTDSGIMEIWKSIDNGSSFDLINNSIEVDLDTNPGNYPRPALVVSCHGVLTLTFFSEVNSGDSRNNLKMYSSYDHGETWEDNTLASQILPFDNRGSQNFDITDEAEDTSNGKTARETLVSADYGGGRMFYIIQNSHNGANAPAQNRYAMFSRYEWKMPMSKNLQAFPQTVIPDKPMWVGVDDVRVVFSGLPVVNDEWDINLQFRYSVKNILIDTPSIFFRSANDTQNVTMEWSRPASVAQLGNGKKWNVDALALFGTNFEKCILDVSVHDYSNDTAFPSSTSDYTRFLMSSVVDVGLLTNTSHTSDGYIIDAAKAWTPHQFKPGLRNYYIAFPSTSNPDNNVGVTRILDNTETSLILEDEVTVTGNQYKIFTDRFFCNGAGGTRGGIVNTPPLMNTEFAHPMWIRLIIPAGQKSQYGYWKIGSALIGTQTPATVIRGSSQYKRSRFSRGFTWNPVTYAQETTGLTGVSTIQEFGRTGQQWTVNYEQVEWWDRDITINPMLSNPLQAFGFIFDDINPSGIELVRLNGLPQIENTVGDRFNYSINIKEIT